MHVFRAPTQAWLDQTFGSPTLVQEQGWPVIARGEHALLAAPTGSGKTLAAFLWCLDRLSTLPADAPPGVRVLYVSPLKALVYDIERNLRAPLAGLSRQAERLGEPLRKVQVDVRTGDTPQRERRQQARAPGDILVTTPESLYLILGSAARETLRSLETVIVDEVHALAPSKRGVHLAVSLERLCAITTYDPQRIGLSATARPLEEVARFVGGDRDVSIVDCSTPPDLDLQIVVPLRDMQRPANPETPPRETGRRDRAAAASEPAPGSLLGLLAAREQPERQQSVWPAIYPELLALIESHTSTIVFVNSRGLCERLAQRLNELAGEPLVRAHHGSLAHGKRQEVEGLLKAGRIRGLVATSSLELGIDMGAVDLVLLVESPGAVTRGLQRVGRAGHGVAQVSKARIFPKHRGDLLEAAVVVRRMLDGDIEPLRVPRNPLDVLAQQVVAAAATEPVAFDDLLTLLRRAAGFRELSREMLTAVVEMLAGRYPSTELADLKPRIIWDRENDVLRGRRGSRSVALMSGGTIPDRGLYAVHVGADGPRVGELDEEMVHETYPGQSFMLGASTWRLERVTRDRVIVAPAPGEPGKLPFWHGDGPGRPIELGRAVGAFTRELSALAPAAAEARLREEFCLDPLAADNLLAYLSEQKEATGVVPSDEAVVIERFRDELGDVRICLLSPFGARAHAPWALAIQSALAARTGFEVQTLWTDDGIALRLVNADGDAAPDITALLPDPEEVEELVLQQLGQSALFASQFRENAARALLLPRRRPRGRTPLWAQRLKAQGLLAATREHPSFPIVLETYRSCLQDIFDLPALVELLQAIRRRDIRLHEVETPSASPFARSLVFSYVATYMYEQDKPLAERRAQALALDRNLLRELLGQEELRALLDAEVIAELEDELQGRADGFRPRDAEELWDLLRRVGDLSDSELAERTTDDPQPWLAELASERRVFRLRIAGEQRWAVAEDVALFRDALGVAPPPGVAPELLLAIDDPIEKLLSRYARTHGPFCSAAPAERYGLAPTQLEVVLRALEAAGSLIHGEIHPHGSRLEWCHLQVLERLKRRTLARLRREVAPVEAAVLARFLPEWHGIGRSGPAAPTVLEAVEQLEGLPLSFAELEQALLPARLPEYLPRWLDELGATGQVVWIGAGALGARDGRVALYRREQVGLLAPRPQPLELEPAQQRIVEHLSRRGASFLFELLQAAETAREEALIALWDLAWAGLVTNDTFQPLRAFARGLPRNRKRGSSAMTMAGGRWSLVSDLLGPEPEPTARAHARVLTLLLRHGVVAREAAAQESMSGRFGQHYRVLATMEEAGKVRRGLFVEGLTGAQFALPGAVERLRAARRPPSKRELLVLAAIDPANAYGATLPWPPLRVADAGSPRRAAGAAVVLSAGRPIVYMERGGQSILTFAAAETSEVPPAIGALRVLAGRRRRRYLRLERIDGEPARRSEWAKALCEEGLLHVPQGLVLEA